MCCLFAVASEGQGNILFAVCTFFHGLSFPIRFGNSLLSQCYVMHCTCSLIIQSTHSIMVSWYIHVYRQFDVQLIKHDMAITNVLLEK